MMQILYIVLAITLITLCAVLSVLCVILARFILDSKLHQCDTAHALKGNVGEKKPIAEKKQYTDEELQAIERRQRELNNFFNYTGEIMPKPEDESK